jgi:hypothetical protein
LVSAQQEQAQAPQGKQSKAGLKEPVTFSNNQETVLNIMQALTAACKVGKQATTAQLAGIVTEPSEASFKYIGVQVLTRGFRGWF